MLSGFSANEFVVYPAHGVGQVIAIEVQTVAGASLELFVLYFAKSKMTLRVPTQKAEGVGMRKLSSPTVIQHVRQTLLQAAPRIRTSWLRLEKEYEGTRCRHLARAASPLSSNANSLGRLFPPHKSESDLRPVALSGRGCDVVVE
jgi:hypothetical protein